MRTTQEAKGFLERKWGEVFHSHTALQRCERLFPRGLCWDVWLCFPCRLCFSEWQRDRLCGQTHTHTQGLRGETIFWKITVNFQTSSDTHSSKADMFIRWWLPIFVFSSVLGLMVCIKPRMLCNVTIIQTATCFVDASFFSFAPVSLVIKIFATTNTES